MNPVRLLWIYINMQIGHNGIFFIFDNIIKRGLIE